MEQFENLRITDEQQLILDKAIELLTPYDYEKCDSSMCYFVDKDGNEFGSEYNCCADPFCINEAKKRIRSDHGNRKIIKENYTNYDSDFDRFESCRECMDYFNKHLTWIGQEFDDIEDYATTETDFKSSDSAFRLIGIYSSLSKCLDYSIFRNDIEQYEMGNRIYIMNKIARRKDLIEKVIKHAELVNKTL